MATTEQQKPYHDEMAQIPSVLTFFTLGHLNNATRLTGGDANHNYMVATQEGREYVVKFPIEQTRESLENDVAIEQQLAAVGIGSSVYLHRPDGRFIFDEGRMAVVSPRINGVHPEVITPELSFSIGRITAEFAEAVKELPNPKQGWMNPAVVAQSTEFEDDPYVIRARAFLADAQSMFDKDLAEGVIHADLHEGNLLVNRDDPTKVEAIFDFEEAERNLLIIDVARTMGAICTRENGTKLDKDLMKTFIDGYSSVRQLTKKELDNLPKAIKWYAGAAILWYIKNGFPKYAQNAVTRVESLDEFNAKPIEIVSSDGEVMLKQYTMEDAEAVFAVIDRNREHLSQHHEDTATKYPTLDVLQESIAHPTNPARLRFAVQNRAGEVVGGINLTPDKENPREGEIGYWQGAEFGGKGYVGRAAEALTRFGFDHVGYDAIYGIVFETNTPSMNVLRRAGYQETGKDDKGYVRFTKQK